MTTSNDHQDSTAPDPTAPTPPGTELSAPAREVFPAGEHWFEMTATLAPGPTAQLSHWIDVELALLEDELNEFVTPGSLKKSLRR